MADFSASVAAQLAGATVRANTLVRFDFKSETVRLWPGFGDLIAGGQTWKGIGNLGLVSSTQTGPGLAVEEMTFQLFGDDRILGNFSGSNDDSIGREVNVYLQFFDVRPMDDAGNWVEWQPLDDPFQIFWGTMGPLSADRPQTEVDGGAVRVISVTAQNAFLNRAKPSFGFYSDRDQKARSPGDNMFASMFRMANVRVKWPKF